MSLLLVMIISLPLRFGIFQVAYENLMVDGGPILPWLEEVDTVKIGYVHTPEMRKYQVGHYFKKIINSSDRK